jgi:hypothetical protein
MTSDQPGDKPEATGGRVRALARPALDVLDRRFEQVHRHLDDVATRLEHSDDLNELRGLLRETVDELRAQSAATLELARVLQSFAETFAARLDAVAHDREARDAPTTDRADGVDD